MLRLLGGLAYYLKWQEISTGSLVFRLHNNFTAVVLLACSMIITANQYVGNPISCIVDGGLPQHVINTYCWITSTFTMPDAFNRQVGKEVAHPGVANDFGGVQPRKYYPYYQWVCFILFFQALMCYTPQWLWNMWEGKLMKTIVMGMNYGLDKEEVLNEKKSILLKYILNHARREIGQMVSINEEIVKEEEEEEEVEKKRKTKKEESFNIDIPVEAFNAYCWIHSTYFVTGAMLGVAGANVAFPGVASSFGILQARYQDESYHNFNGQTQRVKYYQWVAFMLIFQSLIKISHIHIDTAVFRLHYSLTVILLISFSLIVTTRQYVGNPIDCIHSKDIPEDVLNTYCWIHSTYTITAAYRKREGSEVPFPGVDNSKLYPESERKEYRKTNKWHLLQSKMPLMLKMIDVFGSLRSLFKIQRISEDTLVFRLHYRTTVALLLGGCVTLACKSISGSPIHCEASGSVDKVVLETFCWLHTTYSMVHAFNLSIGQAVPYPGVANSKGEGIHGHTPHPLVKQHKYYQWVIFFLLIQAILFYTPRWLWKGWEGGKIHALMMDLDIGLCSEVEKKQKKKMLLDYLWENLRYHNWWAYRYYLCEVLALLNVIGQMFLMNRFFDGAFLTFGIDVLRFLESDQEDRVDPMIYVFPRMTKCTFYKYGIVIIFSPRTRVYLLRLRFRLVRRDAVETIVRRSKVGDWFLLYMLGENLDTVIYRDVMHELANRLASRHHHGAPGAKGELQEA
ncbi:hypothetical protein M0802_003631 [Mischocyttarus mexicanus]|nr:hypothetical protein M0802_003631 [Mischocyttarus mexicanus]